MHRFRTRLVLIGSAVGLILAGGTLGFVWIDHYPPFDAFYMTLITISPVGYEEVHPLSHAGRIFNSFLIFFGVTVMFFAIGVIAQFSVEAELGNYFGRRRQKKMLDRLCNHYIVCGRGRVGRSVI